MAQVDSCFAALAQLLTGLSFAVPGQPLYVITLSKFVSHCNLARALRAHHNRMITELMHTVTLFNSPTSFPRLLLWRWRARATSTAARSKVPRLHLVLSLLLRYASLRHRDAPPHGVLCS